MVRSQLVVDPQCKSLSLFIDLVLQIKKDEIGEKELPTETR